MKGKTVGLTKEHREGGLTRSWTEQGEGVRRKTEQKLMFYRWVSPQIKAKVQSGELPDEYVGTWDADKKDQDGRYVNSPEERTRKLALSKERKRVREQLVGQRFSEEGVR